MEEKISPVTPEQKIVATADEWRDRDKVAISDKGDTGKQRAEYRARQKLRKALDEKRGQS